MTNVFWRHPCDWFGLFLLASPTSQLVASADFQSVVFGPFVPLINTADWPCFASLARRPSSPAHLVSRACCQTDLVTLRPLVCHDPRLAPVLFSFFRPIRSAATCLPPLPGIQIRLLIRAHLDRQQRRIDNFRWPSWSGRKRQPAILHPFNVYGAEKHATRHPPTS
jgi:hypothetical protein